MKAAKHAIYADLGSLPRRKAASARIVHVPAVRETRIALKQLIGRKPVLPDSNVAWASSHHLKATSALTASAKLVQQRHTKTLLHIEMSGVKQS